MGLYKIKLSDGRVINSELFMQKVFGAYSESVQLNLDRTFVPVAWFNARTFKLSIIEQGTYQYSAEGQTLKFDGTFHDEYHIAKFLQNEL